MSTATAININEVLGHYVEAEVTLDSYFGKVKKQLTGRIIYSNYNASLFFKPKGSRTKGYLIDSEEDIHSVSIIRRDRKNNEYYNEAYRNKEQAEAELEKRLKAEEEMRKEQHNLRQKQFELERKRKLEKQQREIESAKQLGGYEELEREVIEFYQSFKDEFFNESFVKNTYIPILNKLIHKGIENVNAYPKHYFDKKRNPKFCAMIEKKLGIKLTNTQKGNVERLNSYLSN